MIRLGTRASALARAQAELVAAALRRDGHAVELVPMRTEGDRLPAARLADVGGKGLFVREIEQALAAGRVDLAVHSLKDLPADSPPGLVLVAYLPREDPRDVLVSRAPGGLAALPAGAVVGTSSLRRRALLGALRPDLVVVPLRGNVDTRLRKLAAGEVDALLLAAAGLRRLGLDPPHADPLPVDVVVPAAGQGIVVVEARADDVRAQGLAARLDDPVSRACALAERACLRRLGASCTTPVAAHARLVDGRLAMVGVLAGEDGRRVLRVEATADPAEAEGLGRRVAESLLAAGGAELAARAGAGREAAP